MFQGRTKIKRKEKIKMKISKVISELANILEKYGDIECVVKETSNYVNDNNEILVTLFAHHEIDYVTFNTFYNQANIGFVTLEEV